MYGSFFVLLLIDYKGSFASKHYDSLMVTKLKHHCTPEKADNSLEYVLLCFHTIKKLSADGGDFVLEIVDFFKSRGAKFRTEVCGPYSKYGRTPYMYLSFGFSDKSSPFFREKLDGAEKRAMLKVVLFLISRFLKAFRSLLLLAIDPENNKKSQMSRKTRRNLG